ncbi:hypothetical protein N7532_003601 [Penicillium argentinense]|uniref:RING-type E3 ubiquitin transferase n=1 Tax=Penicillium argentinense TaxID=1131581 RepID=A0A9W9FN74_9EURO|nr:uncharacterized protein N7532_003601 [Penicillium argentinense]KAJ5103072.1 hypothetical protein N7532_003601 [Penicillium argentinense]
MDFGTGLSRPATPFPDPMNDSRFSDKDKGLEDMDTCRICHGEGTDEEPLFYPCKCSGSIKFVHQTCLVEWLAHSQKKHCELCRKQFQFTKIYDPNMPERLPTPLFIKQASIQCFQTVVTWMRFLLVAFVWLGWLPWSMRAIWRVLFWLADGHWTATGAAAQQRVAQAAQDGMTQLATNGSVADAASVLSSASAIVSSAVQSATASAPTGQLSTAGIHGGDPLMLALIKKAIPSFIPAFTGGASLDGSSPNNTTSIPKARYPSWLSDVKTLNTLTPYPTINNMIIDTLEGQLITLLVVVAFILLFLIREWVVQQQPLANIGELEREAALQVLADNVVNNDRPEEDQPPPPDVVPAHPRADFANAQHEDPGHVHGDILARDPNQSPAPSLTDSSDDGRPVIDVTESDDGHPVIERPIWPHHDRLLEERIPALNDEVPGAASIEGRREFARLVLSNIADHTAGDRDEMLRILRQQDMESLEADLDWFLEEREARSDEQTAQNEDGGLHTESQAASAYAQREEQPPRSFYETLIHWFWGDITFHRTDGDDHQPENDGHVLQDPHFEEPFVPLPGAEVVVINDEDDPAPNNVNNNDVDDQLEGDDLEGIMDLIGMQGPIFGLLQNGVFCALLIAFTIAIGIWLPYLWGKIALVLLANPLELIIGVPMTIVTLIADIALDTLVGVVGYVLFGFSFLFKTLLGPVGSFAFLEEWIPRGRSVTSASLSLIDASTNRLNKVVKAFLVLHESDIPMFSVLSHQALKLHQTRISALVSTVYGIMKFILHDFPLRLATLGVPSAFSFGFDFAQLKQAANHVQELVVNFARYSFSSSPGAKLMNATAANAASANLTADYDLAVWDTKDRAIAILMGYVLATAVGFLYLRISGFLSGTNRGQRAEGIVAEVLLQAAGVMKVILIIGIEMIVFPLYCGTLLDIALLPLFSDATVASRIAFTVASPLTSLFVHWFIGTCYMFHFALFVSMCRKILRSGVLYFIRDPDDPTFHPIRDVLERSITTQLRKIGFSALVYGALVIVCLGGVVWGLFFAFDGILPIHWSATAPMLEFPIDLLFYNFVMPWALQSVKPSDGLHDLYDWWFHKCAHFLRLSNFFFSERHPEEEGHHVRKTWWALLSGSEGDWEHPVVGSVEHVSAETENLDAYFLRDGRYVRAPASDQVRIPKGTQVFLEVTENNLRTDGRYDAPDGLHGRFNTSFTKVYIPPFFRTRIAAFILLIWLFAATTGVGTTIVPLVIGRRIIAFFLSSSAPVNDIYAFSSGVCACGSLAYFVYCCYQGIQTVRENPGAILRPPGQLVQLGVGFALDVARLLYVATVFTIVIPLLFALLTELYILIPAHTLLGDGESHVVHVVQDWTLGVLWVQLAIKLFVRNPRDPHSAATAVFNAIFPNGYFSPNVRIATKALILPLLLFTTAAVAVPLTLGGIARWTVFYAHVEAQSHIYRYAYPATLMIVLDAWMTRRSLRRLAAWRNELRDEVYLIGERLHNYTEPRPPHVGVSRPMMTA